LGNKDVYGAAPETEDVHHEAQNNEDSRDRRFDGKKLLTRPIDWSSMMKLVKVQRLKMIRD
jgi:hypothetical protein